MGHSKVLEFLVDKGANIDAQNDWTDKGQKCTSLHFAVLNGQTDAAKVLASLGAKTDVEMMDGKTVDVLISEVGNDELRKAVTEGKALWATDLRTLAQRDEVAIVKAQIRAGKSADADPVPSNAPSNAPSNGSMHHHSMLRRMASARGGLTTTNAGHGLGSVGCPAFRLSTFKKKSSYERLNLRFKATFPAINS